MVYNPYSIYILYCIILYYIILYYNPYFIPDISVDIPYVTGFLNHLVSGGHPQGGSIWLNWRNEDPHPNCQRSSGLHIGVQPENGIASHRDFNMYHQSQISEDPWCWNIKTNIKTPNISQFCRFWSSSTMGLRMSSLIWESFAGISHRFPSIYGIDHRSMVDLSFLSHEFYYRKMRLLWISMGYLPNSVLFFHILVVECGKHFVFRTRKRIWTPQSWHDMMELQWSGWTTEIITSIRRTITYHWYIIDIIDIIELLILLNYW